MRSHRVDFLEGPVAYGAGMPFGRPLVCWEAALSVILDFHHWECGVPLCMAIPLSMNSLMFDEVM